MHHIMVQDQNIVEEFLNKENIYTFLSKMKMMSKFFLSLWHIPDEYVAWKPLPLCTALVVRFNWRLPVVTIISGITLPVNPRPECLCNLVPFLISYTLKINHIKQYFVAVVMYLITFFNFGMFSFWKHLILGCFLGGGGGSNSVAPKFRQNYSILVEKLEMNCVLNEENKPPLINLNPPLMKSQILP